MPKGSSPLTKWECLEFGLKVRMGIKGNPELRHDPCEKVTGSPVFLIRSKDNVANQVIYQAPDDFNDEPQEKEYIQFDDPEDLTACLEPYKNTLQFIVFSYCLSCSCFCLANYIYVT